MTSFNKELQVLINRTCQENKSNTPDYILADYLSNVLDAFNGATNARTKWYGHDDEFSSVTYVPAFGAENSTAVSEMVNNMVTFFSTLKNNAVDDAISKACKVIEKDQQQELTPGQEDALLAYNAACEAAEDDPVSSVIELADLPKEEAKAAFASAKEQVTAPRAVLSSLEMSEEISFLKEEMSSIKSTLSSEFKGILEALSAKK